MGSGYSVPKMSPKGRSGHGAVGGSAGAPPKMSPKGRGGKPKNPSGYSGGQPDSARNPMPRKKGSPSPLSDRMRRPG